MKRIIKLTILLLTFLMPVITSAHDFEVDGIYYNINGSGVATVTYQGTTHHEYDEYSGDVTIPSSVNYNGRNYPVTAIGNDAFRNCTELTNVTMPNSMISIGSYAFYNCTKLASVTIPNSVFSISDNAFRFCKGLTSATIGNAVRTIGDEAFFGCNNLVNVTIGDAVTTIGSSAFEGCSQMSSVNIPNTVTAINSRAFYGCRRLETITIPNSVKTIGDEAFSNCLDLIDVYSYILDPSQVTTGSNLFFLTSSSDYAERTLHVPSNTLATYQNSNNWAPFFGTITNDILNSFEVGGLQYFITSDTTVTVTHYNLSYNYNSLDKSLDIEIPNHVTFNNVVYTVTAIGDNVFINCSELTSVTIPNSVTSIGNYAFFSCSNLTSVTCLATSPPSLSNTSFSNYNATLTVPKQCKSIYQAMDYWNRFSTITELSYDFIINSIYYTITSDNTVGVTYSNSNYNSYSGSIIIPTTVSFNSTTYQVTSISNYAFCYCSALIDVTIPNTILSIGSSAFSGCSGLTCITIPNSVTTIGNSAFYYCTALDTLNYNAISCADFSLYQNPFNNLNISTINIGDSVLHIPAYFAYGLTKLTTLTIPNSVKYIRSFAFYGCSNLHDVYSFIAEPSLTTIGSCVFYLNSSNYSNRTLYVPVGSVPSYLANENWNQYFSTIIDMDSESFSFNDRGILYLTTSDSTVTVYGYNINYDEWDLAPLGIALDIEIPTHVTYNNINYTVTAIGDNAFNSNYYTYCITIPETIVSIGKSAIHGSYEGTYVVCLAEIPPEMNESFDPNDNHIELFVLADAYPLYKEINDNNHYFSSIHITDGEKTPIPTYVVTNLIQDYGLAQYGIYYPDDPKYYCYGCRVETNSPTAHLRAIETSVLGEDILFDSSSSFDYVSDRESRYLHIQAYDIQEGKSPSRMSEFCEYGPFNPKWEYENFDLIDSRIAYNICGNEVSVTNCTFIERVGERRFYSLYSGNVEIPSSTGKYNTYPVTSIGTGAFGTIFSWSSYGYYNSDDIFDYYGYVNTDLISVTLPASIDSVSSFAFEHAPNLSYIKCLGKIPAKAFDDSFDEGVLQNTTLYVPMAALSAYKSAEGWKDFQHIVGFTDYDFVADGFYFKITGDNEVMVTSGENAYQGVINIPTNVTYNGVTYNVTGISDGAFADATLQSLILPVTTSSIGNTAFNNCHINTLIISSNGTWSAGAINCEVDNLYVMSTVTGIQGLQVNPTTAVYSYSTLPPTCNDESFTGYDATLHVPASALAAYFTAPYWNNFINITSDAVEPTSLTINKDSVEVLVGNQLTLTATAIPADATPSKILWTSSDKSIATITNGVVTALHVGECDITAYLLDKTAVCHVTVTEIAPTQITLNQEFAKLEVGSQLTLTATVSPDDATDKYVTWSTTNSAVATVDSLGNVLAVGTGECFIIANCRDNQAMCHIIVVDHFIFITLDEHEVNLLPNHMIVLTPSVMPENTSLTVTSTNTNVAAARLANGKIQVVGITEGRTTIKVNSTDGYAEADSCLVKVYTLRGDVNIDGYVNISDVTSLINHLLGGQDMINEVNADTNNDGKINISDVTRLINYLLGGDELDPKEEPIDGAETITVNGVSFTMLPVEGGTFTMGATPEQGTSDPWTVEYPTHEVTLSTFSIGETEVTQALWQAVMGNNPSEFTGDLSRPVEMVSWDDCQQFIVKLNQMTGRNFRLPTEAEWEYAARGGKKTQGYKYAGSNDIDEVSWWDSNSCDGVGPDSPDYGTHPVARKKANELGLYDMSGNVWEWCQDWFGDYSSEPQTNPTGPESGDNRVYRGGSWINYAKNCRVSSRFHWGMTGANNIGLRLAL